MKSTYFIYIFLLSIYSLKPVSSLWCYRCVNSHPGCGMFDFDWRYYWSHECPDPNDKCVKVIEEKGADIVVTRDCLTYLEGHRKDIPADRYEGCREAAMDPFISHYANATIRELDTKRNYYDRTMFCFCSFDERCNGVATVGLSVTLLCLTAAIKYVL